MGCSIHLYKEEKINGEWVTADGPWEYDEDMKVADIPWEDRYTGQDYDLFGFLATGVRSNHEFSFDPRGLPLDMCPEVEEIAKYWENNMGHSHSWLSLAELEAAVGVMKANRQKYKNMFKVECPNCGHMGALVYEEGFLEFSSATPDDDLGIIYGLEEIIGHFGDVEDYNKDGYRIVFWFDS